MKEMSENLIPPKISYKNKKEFIVILIVFSLLLFFGSILGYKGFKHLYNELLYIKKIQDEQNIRNVETNQFLLSTVDWANKRIHVILFMRDQIIDAWKKTGVNINYNEAYSIAETIMKECESYTYIDPFFVLSLQNIESNFNKVAKSKMGALGICQIMPSTGRLLAGYFGIEYMDSILFNTNINIKFAVKLIDVLYAQYQNWEQVLADYNGGPWQAYYYKNNKSKMSEETNTFVPKVINKQKEYDSLFVKFRINTKIDYIISGGYHSERKK